MNLFEYFTTENLSGKKCNDVWLKNNNFKLYEDVINWCDCNNLKEIEFKRKVYHYINQLAMIPTCKVCGGNVKYRRLRDGYNSFCSDSCVKKSPDYKNKWRSSMSKTLSSGEFIEKRHKTCVDKYGDDYQKVIQKNREKSLKEKYGVLNSFQIQEVQEIRKITLQEKYGSDKFNNPEKTKQTRISNKTQIDDSKIEDFILYKKIVINRTLTIYRNNVEMINPKNLKRSKSGYHLDHIFSIKQAFINNIPVEVISHPCNLHLIYCKENLVKQDDCWISIQELLNNIILFNQEIVFTHSSIRSKYSNIRKVCESLLLDLKLFSTNL
jgi:hypothetical protein